MILKIKNKQRLTDSVINRKINYLCSPQTKNKSLTINGTDERRCIAMLIIPIKDGENIDRALKKFKRKFDSTKTMKGLRDRKQFTKPSVIKRQQKLKAKYIQGIRTDEEKG